ncbi:MAG: hypothetical protein ACOYOR_01925 [Flavobacterium psychrophilum]|jgi:cytochrome c5
MKNKHLKQKVAAVFIAALLLACSSPKTKIAAADKYDKVSVSPAVTPKLALVALDAKGNIIPVDEKVKEKILVNRMNMLTDAESAGRDLFNTRCVECHDLAKPQQFDESKWAIILDRMKDKAKLDDKSFALIKQYTAIYFEK